MPERCSELLREYSRNKTAAELYLKSCAEPYSRPITVFGIGFDTRRWTQADFYPYKTGDFNITTTIKEAPGCRGSLLRRTCLLEPATVEYGVRVTNDTIALLSGDGYGYRLAERANASPNAHTDATDQGDEMTWRPRQDNVVALTASFEVSDVNVWTRFFSILYEPMLVKLRVSRDESFDRFIDCVPDNIAYYSNTSCISNARIHRHDLAQDYAVEPHNYTT